MPTNTAEAVVIFGRNLRARRLAKKLSQEALYRLSGVKQAYISEIELGHRNLSVALASTLARSLDASLPEMFQDA